MPAFKSETELAATVVNWLEGFEVYQEVESSIGAIADIVVNVNGLPWVIECKKSFGLSVLEQAVRWKMFGVPRVSVAVPSSRRRGRRFAEDIAQWQGIGVLEVETRHVNERLQPTFQRMRKRFGRRWNLLEECREEHKTFCEAGSQSGRFTPFKLTVSNLVEVVTHNPGITMKEAIERMEEHHYRTNKAAYSNLMVWLRRGVITDVEARGGEGKALRLYLKGKEQSHG